MQHETILHEAIVMAIIGSVATAWDLIPDGWRRTRIVVRSSLVGIGLISAGATLYPMLRGTLISCYLIGWCQWWPR